MEWDNAYKLHSGWQSFLDLFMFVERILVELHFSTGQTCCGTQ